MQSFETMHYHRAGVNLVMTLRRLSRSQLFLQFKKPRLPSRVYAVAMRDHHKFVCHSLKIH